MMTTRRFARSRREAFREWPENCLGIERPVIRCSAPRIVVAWRRVVEFVGVYRKYRRHHGIVYSARIAYGCAFKGLPF